MNIQFSRVAKYAPAALGALLLAGTAIAASYSLFGEASVTQPGYNSDNAVTMVSDTNPGYGGVDFTVPAGTTFADLTTLSTDFNVTDDDCTNGSPRFQINVDTGSDIKNIFAYLGPQPAYSGCTPNTWTNSGDLLETGKFVDTSQLGGTFYDPYDTAVVTYGSLPVVGIQLVTDAGYASAGEQTILADNVMINSDVYTFEPPTKDDCKNGGWQNFTEAPGPFKNQGQCVSHFARNK